MHKTRIFLNIWVAFAPLLFSCFISLLTPPTAIAQVEFDNNNAVRVYTPGFGLYASIDGSPYIPSDTLKSGWLLNGNKQVFSKLRYNSYSGSVEYLQNGKLTIPTSPVLEFMILTPDTMHFQKGFPIVQTRSVNDFYQLLYSSRKTKLLKHTGTTIFENKDVMSTDLGKKSFQQREIYYVWINQVPADTKPVDLQQGTMLAVVLSPKSLLKLFPNQADSIKQYISERKLKLKSWTDFSNVLTFIDSKQ